MKTILAFLMLLFFLFPSNALAQENWTIDNFHSIIKIWDSGEVTISEEIDVDFKNLEKHGIYRDIPYKYMGENGNIYTEIKVNEVLEDGKKAQIQTTKNDSNIRIRIGNPNKTINGQHTYFINYGVSGVLSDYPEFDEFYWNVTGDDWEAPISSASAEITSSLSGILQAACYEGYLGSEDACSSQVPYPAFSTFSTTKQLPPGEGFTIAVKLEKGLYPIITVEKPKSLFEKLISWPSITTFAISFICGIGVIIFFWWKYGRDFWTPGITGFGSKNVKGDTKPLGTHEPVVVEFTPPENLPPAIIGVIADERADTLDVTSTLIDLAGKGYLTITEIPKKWLFGSTDYLLKKTSKDTGKLHKYEKELLSRIFSRDEVKISELKQKFYTDLAKVKDKIYEEVVEKKLFETNPEKIRTKYLAIGILILAAGIFITVLSIANEIILTADIGIASVIIGIITVIFAGFMPKRTAYGREMYRRIKGYRMFIESAEKYRQRFFENKNMFNEVLPYAIVFGLTAKFAKALADMGIKPQNPSWYHGVHAFNMTNFSNEVSTFSNSLSSAIASAPKSSGFSGGSSGGGFGGGGGGSW